MGVYCTLLHPDSIVRSPSVSEVKEEISRILRSTFFKQAPKLCGLLEYVCDKALLHEGDKTTEYTIAIDVFGKASNFKESKDSSVRVEVYRLRKRLAQYYESEGRDSSIRIVIPHGRYAPEFVFTDSPFPAPLQTQSAPAAIPEIRDLPNPLEIAQVEAVEPAAEHASLSVWTTAPSATQAAPARLPMWIVWSAILVMAAALVGILLYRSEGRKPAGVLATNAAAERSRSDVAPSAPPAGFQPIRIMAGYTGPIHRNTSGTEWGPDLYFQGGRPDHRDVLHVGRTNDPLLFQNARIGDCSYDIPLPPGNYELHLYFVEPEFGPEVGRGENDRTFFLHLNDKRIAPAIDIESEAMGPNIADERVFKDIHPGANGKLHIALESGTGVPLVNAIEILPGLPHAQLPVRIVPHPVPFVDHLVHVWQADDYYLNGQTCPRSQPVTNTPDPALFAMERYGHFDYSIPVDVNGRFTVILHFAEFYFGPSAAGKGGVGSRVFNVTCNGIMLLENLDIFKEVGTAKALTKVAYHIKPSAQGRLNLTFEPVVNYALIDGIEVFDESQ